MAPERVRRGETSLPADAAEAVLRRQVLLGFPAGIDPTEHQRLLQATGLFRQVTRLPDRPTPVRWAQANTEPFGTPSSDPHRWQWALPAIAAPGTGGAWHLTTGRAMLSSVDTGIVPGHADMPLAALGNFRLHNSSRIIFNTDPSQGPIGPALRPNELAIIEPNQPPPHHGTHVNTLMAAPINGQGIAGVCPTCTLQTFRTEFDSVLATGAILSGRFGASALNMSFEPFQVVSNQLIQFALALDVLANRDVTLAASAGNDRVAVASWDAGTVPHGKPYVLKIGATDADHHLWDEGRIVTLPTPRRHPVRELANLCTTPGNPDCIPWVIANRCAGPSGGSQCGSSFGAVANVIDLVAPGAQVIGGMVSGTPSSPNVYVDVPAHPTNPNAQAPSRTGLGVAANGVAFNDPSPAGHHWGPMTGTSMAAPHVTATAGLMRSINPLLAATAVRQGLRDGANPNVPGYTPARMGAGLLNARQSVERAAGSVRGTVQRNRLVPMFALYAASTTVQEEIGSEEFEAFGSQPLHAWLYTTNPQLAAAATAGDIYLSSDAAFSPTMPAAYEHSHRLEPASRRTGIPVPLALYELPSGAGKGFRNPAASFWVFTTPHSPLAGYTLQPIYRLSNHHAAACAAEQRKHLYTTRESEALGFIGGTPVCGAQPLAMRYRFESIEGYVFDRAGPRPPGALALFRGYNPALKVAALVVESEQLTTAFAGYSVNTSTLTSNADFLGWVYPSFVPTGTSTASTTPADVDGDGLIDGLELAFGLNERSADGDCDGVSDAIEYGFANLPGDPMSPTASCTDGRIKAVYNAGLQTVTVTLSNPVGPVALPVGTKVVVHFTAPAQGPVVLMGGGGSQCQSMAAIGWNAAYECTLDAPLPVGPNSAIVWEWNNVGGPLFQLGQNSAAITVITGLGDPVTSNNSASF
jgi:subtilisin family serine protease